MTTLVDQAGLLEFYFIFLYILQDDSETNVLATLLVAQFNVIVSTTVA